MNDGLIMKYFVLNPHKDDAYGKASREALITYANRIAQTNPELCEDILEWLREIREKV